MKLTTFTTDNGAQGKFAKYSISCPDYNVEDYFILYYNSSICHFHCQSIPACRVSLTTRVNIDICCIETEMTSFHPCCIFIV